MSKPVPYLLQGKNIIIVLDNKSHTISKATHIAYAKIVEAIRDKKWDELRLLVEPAKAIVDFGAGNVSIVDGKVFWRGEPFHNSLTERMIGIFNEGGIIDPMVRFVENLMRNPSKRSVQQAYTFLERNNLPITEDGHFLAFKRVRSDYKDVHSGKIDNSIGQVVAMERNLVDDNPDSTCSTGLHFCSESYLGHFGGQGDPVMILKIDPADVVSIPSDYNGAKGRCAKYKVVGQVSGSAKDAFVSFVNGDYDAPEADDEVVDGSDEVSYAPAVETVKGAWPFPTGGQPSSQLSPTARTVLAQLFDVVRVYGGKVEATGLTYSAAEDLIDKNIRQKKAMLKMVLQGKTE